MMLFFSKAQSIQSQANLVAHKMKDSLSLSNIQKDSIYKITVQLLSKKIVTKDAMGNTVIRNVYTESQRDDLYRNVLTEEQYALYQQKKQHLINN